MYQPLEPQKYSSLSSEREDKNRSDYIGLKIENVKKCNCGEVHQKMCIRDSVVRFIPWSGLFDMRLNHSFIVK